MSPVRLHNNLKVPYPDQFSFGIRNIVRMGSVDWNTSATLVRIESHPAAAYGRGLLAWAPHSED